MKAKRRVRRAKERETRAKVKKKAKVKKRARRRARTPDSFGRLVLHRLASLVKWAEVFSVYAVSTIFHWLIAIDDYFPGCVIVGTIMIRVGLPINRLCNTRWLFLHMVSLVQD